MPKQSKRCLGSKERKRRKGGGSRQDRRGAPINLPPMSCFISLRRVFLIRVLSFPCSLTLSFPITWKGCCHLQLPPSLTREEHIKVGLKPREARDQSRALISLGRRRTDGYARPSGGGGYTPNRAPTQSSKMQGGETQACPSDTSITPSERQLIINISWCLEKKTFILKDGQNLMCV